MGFKLKSRDESLFIEVKTMHEIVGVLVIKNNERTNERFEKLMQGMKANKTLFIIND